MSSHHSCEQCQVVLVRLEDTLSPSPWYRNCFGKLIVTQLVKNFPSFLQPEVSSPCSQNYSSQLNAVYIFTPCFSKIHFNINLGPTGWMIGVLGFDSRLGLGIFVFTTASRTVRRPTQPPIQWVPGALSLGVKRVGREADHSPPSSAEIKEFVELYFHSPIRLHGVVLS
jgi:hypothetical protein